MATDDGSSSTTLFDCTKTSSRSIRIVIDSLWQKETARGSFGGSIPESGIWEWSVGRARGVENPYKEPAGMGVEGPGYKR